MKQAIAIVVLAMGFLAACANTPPVPPSATANPSAPTSSPRAAERSISATAAPSPTVICAGITAESCQKAIGLVRNTHPLEIAGALAIVVADVCPPTVACDRLYPFDSIVVLVPRAGASWARAAFRVVGTGDPERVEAWSGALPQHIAALLPTP
jgi:hypothetical protein